jgi:hypothetical protein
MTISFPDLPLEYLIISLSLFASEASIYTSVKLLIVLSDSDMRS